MSFIQLFSIKLSKKWATLLIDCKNSLYIAFLAVPLNLSYNLYAMWRYCLHLTAIFLQKREQKFIKVLHRTAFTAFPCPFLAKPYPCLFILCPSEN